MNYHMINTPLTWIFISLTPILVNIKTGLDEHACYITNPSLIVEFFSMTIMPERM